MSIVAKRSPISATAELLTHIALYLGIIQGIRMDDYWYVL